MLLKTLIQPLKLNFELTHTILKWSVFNVLLRLTGKIIKKDTLSKLATEAYLINLVRGATALIKKVTID